MWMFGLSHLLTRKLSVGLIHEESLIPVARARIDRSKNTVMVRHDISKTVTTRISLCRIRRHCGQTEKFNSLEHEYGFKVTQRPDVKTDEQSSLESFITPTKREASISIGKKECKMSFKHVKKLNTKVEAQMSIVTNTKVP